MSSNPAEYQIPNGRYTTDFSQPTETISDRVDLSFYREQNIEPKNNVYSEKISEINNNILKLRENYLDSHFFATSQGGTVRAIAKRLMKINKIHKLYSLTEEDLIKKESREIGASIFGEMLPNEHREFFMDHEGHWFFYKQITNPNGSSQSITLHYEVLPAGILCINNESGIKGEFLQGEHLENFMIATDVYNTLVQNNIYNHNPYAGKKTA